MDHSGQERRGLRRGAGIVEHAPVQRFGPFTLIDALAEGGMGEVWLAAPQGIAGAPELVVLKRIKSELADDDNAVTRFVDESRLGLLLRHPCISRTIDAGRADGSDYLAAELVEGIDLANVLGRAAKAKRRIEPLLSCWMMAMALDGLDYAHQAKHPVSGEPLGVVHRDISPANLMATRDGLVRVIDFGLALSSVRQAQTMMGIVLGKLGYMAPEQARGLPVGAPCDVFAAGVVLYELIIGKRHYGPLPRERLAKVVAEGKFRAALADEVDLATSGLYSAMVDQDPAARPTAGQARDVLLAHVEHLGGVDEATAGVAALIAELASEELARVDEARSKAQALPPLEVVSTSSGPNTISVAISESVAVQALLNTMPPAVTRESSAGMTLVPGQMWRPSPSLLNIAKAHLDGAPSTPPSSSPSISPSTAQAMAAAETTALPQAPSPPPSSPPPMTTSTATVPLPAARRQTAVPLLAGAAVGALVLGVLIGTGFGAGGDAVGENVVAGGAAVVADAVVADAVVAEGVVAEGVVAEGVVAEGVVADGVDPDAGPSPTPAPTPLPAPAPAAAPPTSPPPPAPPAKTPTKTPRAAHDPLLDRVRHLARCDHACGKTFQAPARTGIGSFSDERRRALEGLVTNCERYCP